VDKRIQYDPIGPDGSPQVYVLGDRSGSLVKTASYVHPLLQEYEAEYHKDPNSIALVVTAMGSCDFWGQNVNGDRFDEDDGLTDEPEGLSTVPLSKRKEFCLGPSGLMHGYTSFYRAGVYRQHVNKDFSKSFGSVELAVWNSVMHRVELVLVISRAKAKEFGHESLIQRIDDGYYPPVSMGCRVLFDICYICGNKAPTRAQYCEHTLRSMGKILPDGRQVGVRNPKPKFFDISLVEVPAAKEALAHRKLASEHTCDGYCVPDSLLKTAAPARRTPILSVDLAAAEKYLASPVKTAASTQTVDASAALLGIEREIMQAALNFQIEKQVLLEKAKAGTLSNKGADETIRQHRALFVSQYGMDPENLQPIPIKEASAPSTLKIAGTKKADIMKEVPALGGIIRALEGHDPLSLPDLSYLSEKGSLPQIASSTAPLGIILTPLEFQTIILLRRGMVDEATSLYERGLSFPQNTGVSDFFWHPRDFQVDDDLASLIPERSFFRPYVEDRLLRSLTSGGGIHRHCGAVCTCGSSDEIQSPLLNSIGRLYNGYRQQVPHMVIRLTPKAIQDSPDVGRMLTVLRIKTASDLSADLDNRTTLLESTVRGTTLEKLTPLDWALVLSVVPVTYMLSAHYRSKQIEGQELGVVEKALAQHPALTTIATMGVAAKALESRHTAKQESRLS